MSTTPESTILLVGLSGTGKTNFLVGLDVILDDQTDPDGLMHSEFAPDRAYLQPLKEQWFRGEELDHTSRQIPPPPHQLLVLHQASGTRTAFHVPDLAGESFDSQFVTRSFPNEFGNRLQQSAGIILFLHCDHNADHALHEHPTFADASPGGAVDLASATPASSLDWRLEDASKQVKLVDLLQFMAEIRAHSPLRVAIVISAWDLVVGAVPALEPEMPKDPERFLAERWPLLNQFIEGNCESFPSRIFGVSARGGGTTTEEIARLTMMTQPRERILIVDGTERSNDLTRPVRWLLGLLKPVAISHA